MAIDVRIFDEREEKIPLPIEIVLGRDLMYGKRDAEHLVHAGAPKMHEMADGENKNVGPFCAFLPYCAVRGFEISYLSGEGSGVALRIELPAAPDEIREFFNAAVRVSDFFGGAPVIADGNTMTAEKFMSNLEAFLSFNEHLAVELFAGIISGERDPEYMQCALFPVTVGKNEASSFGGTIEGFVEYIDDLKRLDTIFASPHIQEHNGKTVGVYVLPEGVRTVLPRLPYLPPDISDRSDGTPVKCDKFRITFYSSTESKILGTIDYEDFLALVPEGKRTYFDPDRFMLTLTVFEIASLLKMKPLQSEGQRRKQRFASNKSERKIYFVSTVISAVVLAAMLMISDFVRNGFSWLSAIIYPASTAAIYAMFYLIGRLFAKERYGDVTDLRARKKLDEAEKELGLPQNNKFIGFINRGSAVKAEYCETSMYFLADKIFLLHCYKKKVYTVRFRYQEIKKIYTNANLFCIEISEKERFVIDMKTDYEVFKARSLSKKLGLLSDERHESYSKLFMTYYEATDNVGGNLIEFRFADAKTEENEKVNGRSVFSSYREYFVLKENYEKIFFPDKESDFIYGASFDAAKTQELISALKESGKNDETLIPWLEEAAQKHGGFKIISGLHSK